MMAPDSSVPTRAALPAEALDALRNALVPYVRDGTSEEAVREALQRLASEARTRAIPPEEVLVHLKRVWGSISPTEVKTAPAQNAQVLQRVVTMCIQEYFR